MQGTNPYLSFYNTGGTRIGYLQHNATELVLSSDIG